MVEMIQSVVGPWWFILAIVVAILGVGRLARIVTFDKFPPAAWVRQQWANLTKDKGDWVLLLYCWWCATPWIMLACIGWFMLSFTAVWIAWTWWIFWGWLGLSYVSSMILARDEPKE